MIFMPSRHGKSFLCSHYFPAWYLGNHPDKRIILASHEHGLATQWGQRARDTLEEYGEEVFGVRIRKDKRASDEWEIENHAGGMKTAGIGSSVRGRGADVLIIDDVIKDFEQAMSVTWRERCWNWWTGTARGRLEPGGSVVFMNTRWHPEDLPGKLLTAREDQWRVIRLPAVAEENDPIGRAVGAPLWPERVSGAELADLHLDLTPANWAAEFQQSPMPEGGTEWPPEWFTDRPGKPYWFEEWPHLVLKGMFLDPSKGASDKSGDYSSWCFGGKDREGNVWLDFNMERRNTKRIVDDGVEIYRGFGPCDGIGCEINQFQELIQDDFDEAMRREGFTYHPYGIHNHVNKNVRIRRLTPLLSRGKLRVRKTPGGKLATEQMKQFSGGTYDDGPDSAEGLIRVLQEIELGKAERLAKRPTRIRV